MSQAQSFASLEPKLLANKGTARPAMRAGNGDSLQSIAAAQSALGWNDTGDETGTGSGTNTGVNTVAETRIGNDASANQRISDNPKSSEQVSAHRAAFTLRLDPDRHFKLRLASTLQNCSAQLLVTEALDRFLEDIPQLDSLAEKANEAKTGPSTNSS